VCAVTAPEKGGLGTCSAVMKHGDVCQPTCAKGFEVSGENRCVNGTIDEPATCKPARCTLSAPPSNGSVGKCPPTLQHGESCEPACDDGYEPATDDSSLRCDHGALSEFRCKPRTARLSPTARSTTSAHAHPLSSMASRASPRATTATRWRDRSRAAWGR
jgi:hypothetical protein